jgi:hypothetical protein
MPEAGRPPRTEQVTKHYSARKIAKRNQSFRKHIAVKNNPVRFVVSLPSDVNLDDIDWHADFFERTATKLREMKERWAREDDARRRKRAAEIMAEVKRDT